MRTKTKIISLMLCTFLIVAIFPVSKAIKTIDSNNLKDDELTRVSFVIGIGIYIYGGTWPIYDEISPIFLIRLGKPFNLDIHGNRCGERIDFMQGDKFIGYYPFLNPIGVDFVCGIWIDK
jgi:hypothetical protein